MERDSPVSLLGRLNRPEYVFQPTAAAKRLRHGRRLLESSEVTLPWGQPMTVTPDQIGRSIALTRVFDLCVTEVIYRLLEPGGVAVDVGANIGYVTNLMATRVGPDGKVIAFEPQPTVYAALERNVTRWKRDPRLGAVELHSLAVSNRAGIGRLEMQPDFERHMGLATLGGPAQRDDLDEVEVSLVTLDEQLGDQAVDLIKIDVEGHEHAVLEGARGLLHDYRVRYVVFEEHGIYPTPAMTFLEQLGMTLLTLDHSLLGPRVHPVREGPAPPGWPGPNYLATREPERSLALLNKKRWRCLTHPAPVAIN